MESAGPYEREVDRQGTARTAGLGHLRVPLGALGRSTACQPAWAPDGAREGALRMCLVCRSSSSWQAHMREGAILCVALPMTWWVSSSGRAGRLSEGHRACAPRPGLLSPSAYPAQRDRAGASRDGSPGSAVLLGLWPCGELAWAGRTQGLKRSSEPPAGSSEEGGCAPQGSLSQS